MKGEIISNASEVPCLGEEICASASIEDGHSWDVCIPRRGDSPSVLGAVRTDVSYIFSHDANDGGSADE